MKEICLNIDRGVKLENTDEEYFLSDALTHRILPITSSAGFIWERIEQGLSKEEIVSDMLVQYKGVTRKIISRDFNNFLESLKKTGFLSSPNYKRKFSLKLASVCFGITGLCNLHCKHCLAGSTLGRKDEFSLRQIENIVRQMQDLGVGSISLFGGEPMLRKDFFQILDICSRSKLGLSLNTNGTLITQEAVRKFKESRLNSFCVSLDGASAKVHDAFRGRGSFAKTIKGLANLVAAGFRPLVSTIVTRYNHQDLKNIVQLARDMGVAGVRFNSVYYGGNALCFSKEILLNAKEKFKVLAALKDLKGQNKDFITGSECQVIDILKELKGKEPPDFPLIVKPCGAAMNKCGIRPDGYIVPCELLWDVKCANVKDKSLKDIWENDPILDEFRRPILLSRDKIPGCVGCQYVRLCYQGHRCTPYHFSGSFYKNRVLYCWKDGKV